MEQLPSTTHTTSSRRDFLKLGGMLALFPKHAWSLSAQVSAPVPRVDTGVVVNDIHSQLNATRVDRVVRPTSIEELRLIIQSATAEGRAISIAGGRHAMGGQQFGEGNTLIDMRGMNRVLEDWARLTYYTHKYKRRAFDFYTKRYLATSGQIYWADSQLSGAYVDNYHEELDRKLHAKVRATEIITEIYVPRESLVNFMEDARTALRELKVNVIYGTVRLIEKDEESFLRWAKEPYACVIFNLHTTHDPQGIESSARAFRALIDLGIRYNGSYYLTYHRYATRRQVETCYPQFREFLQLKLRYDPDEVFQSDWYRHYKKMFSGTDR